ncbi:Arabinose efflux permease family protein [Frankia sp. AiPs1]|uniref:MFS transporter n=1 Tax=Frankia sp. AiPa1 TaxID=573492 RepID=UPI00202B9EDD|nr:MFS transporter [Frankia sp. AiPa1]MCL9761576.1 MFS transporter [Frankia sp. AiPa1]
MRSEDTAVAPGPEHGPEGTESVPDGTESVPGTPGAGFGYRRLLLTPGAARFILPAFVGRLPLAMHAMGTVLFIQARTGSYAVGGGVAACGAISEAVCAPAVGRALDQHGQARVLLLGVCGHLLGVAGLLSAVWSGAPRPTWFAAAVVAGASLPPVGSCARARWSRLLAGSALLPTAFALEAALDELVFILGPTFATALVAVVAPYSALLVSASLLVVGALGLALQRGTDPGPHPPSAAPRQRILRLPAVRVLMAIVFAIGVGFGGFDVSMVAFARERNLAAFGGLLLGLFASGSAASGLISGARAGRRAPRERLLRAAMLLPVGFALPLAGVTIAAMVPLAILAGATAAPTMISANATMERLVDARSRTEGFAWLIMAIASGVAVGSPLAGELIDSGGARRGLVVPAAAGLAAGLAALLGRHRLQPPSPGLRPQPPPPPAAQ